MLAEIFMLKTEATVREARDVPRFVPIVSAVSTGNTEAQRPPVPSIRAA